MRRSNISLIILLLVCDFTVLSAIGQTLTSVTVKIHNNSGQSVSLYEVEDGEAKRLSFRWLVNDTCVFSIPVHKEAVYFLRKTGSKPSNFNYVLYLKPGDNKWVDAYSSFVAVDFDSLKTVKPNKETVLLQQWTNLFNQHYKLGTNQSKRQQFIESYGSFVSAAEQLKKAAVTTNKYFYHLFTSKIDVEVDYMKASAFFNFVRRMNSGYDSLPANQSFYQSLAGKKYCDAGLLYSEHGMELLQYYLGYNLFQKGVSAEQMLAMPFVDKAAMICNDSVKAAYALNRMEIITDYERFTTDIKPFKSLFKTEGKKQAYQKKEDELTIYAKGAQAFSFQLEDTKGKMVSLSDFKGKVVVVDIWAMWCAPCLAEKPIYQKIEEEFKHRNDIVFLGISFDGLAQKEVWKKFVARKGWKSIELIANHNDSFGKYYKIGGLPTFMIFDKEGKIVTVDAPRPSDPAFKKIIEQTLTTTDHATNY